MPTDIFAAIARLETRRSLVALKLSRIPAGADDAGRTPLWREFDEIECELSALRVARRRPAALKPTRCPHCDGPMDDQGVFEGMCSPCGREYADADPSSLGPDA